MNGGKLYDLKAVLGHADIKTTERYAHLSQEHLAGVKDIIQPRIENYGVLIEISKSMMQNKSRSIHVLTNETQLSSSF